MGEFIAYQEAPTTMTLIKQLEVAQQKSNLLSKLVSCMIKLSFVIYRDTIVYCQADYSFGTTNKVNGLDPMVLMNGVCQALQIPISHKKCHPRMEPSQRWIPNSIQVAPVIKKIWLVCQEVDVFELELNDKVI